MRDLMMNKTQTGNVAENLARAFLENKGLKLIKEQYRIYRGEIDLIMRDKNELVFIEVRYRKSASFMDPIETISATKQNRLIRAALHFQQFREWACDMPSRFDVVTILGDQQNPKITWIPNAFGVK